MITRQIRVRGRVQGVGFRYALRREAQRWGVRGWVRNRADGSVEAVLQGEPAAVAQLVQWARHGPPAARVDALSDSRVEGAFDREYHDFSERRNA